MYRARPVDRTCYARPFTEPFWPQVVPATFCRFRRPAARQLWPSRRQQSRKRTTASISSNRGADEINHTRRCFRRRAHATRARVTVPIRRHFRWPASRRRMIEIDDVRNNDKPGERGVHSNPTFFIIIGYGPPYARAASGFRHPGRGRFVVVVLRVPTVADRSVGRAGWLPPSCSPRDGYDAAEAGTRAHTPRLPWRPACRGRCRQRGGT